jgi:hypothetical protein
MGVKPTGDRRRRFRDDLSEPPARTAKKPTKKATKKAATKKKG